MAVKLPVVIGTNLKLQRLQPGDTLPGGVGLPTPDEQGQVLYATTATAFEKAVPIHGPSGWLVSGGTLLVK